MEFSLKINGVYHDFKAKNPVEAAELIRVLTANPGSPSRVEDDPIGDDDVFGDSTPPNSVEAVLATLRATKTAKFLKVLAGLEGCGGTDAVIKAAMSEDGDINLAPYVASISKACKRARVKFSDVLLRREKRVRAGKVLYYYRLTDEAAEYINSVPDFEVDEEFGIDPHAEGDDPGVKDKSAKESHGEDDDSREERDSLGKLPVADAIRELLTENAGGLRSRDIVSTLKGRIDSQATDHEKLIGSSLYRLKKSKAIQHDKATGIYKIAKDR